MVIAYASLQLSQRQFCTTRREMLAAVVMCTHLRSYLRGAQFTLRTDHSSLRWLQKFWNGDGMLARWYLLLGQFSVTLEYRPGAQHAKRVGLLANVASASVLIVRCRRWIRRFRTLSRRQRWWICLSPRVLGFLRQVMIRRLHDSLFAGHLGISSSDSCVLAGTTPGCSNIYRIVHSVHSKEIPMPSKGSYGPCGSRPPLGESRHGLVGHVNHVGEGKSLCVSNGGLLLSVDGGLSAS